MSVRIIHGDCRDVLATLPADSFDCCVTSPPYWGLRDYGMERQIGLEPTMQDYLETMVGVCREIKRVLKPQGTLWLNIWDSYNARPGHRKATDKPGAKQATNAGAIGAPSRHDTLLKSKDLCMIPNRLAILLQDDGWYVRSEIIWHKPNPMPESVRDRPTCAHEKVWLLTKSAKYFYDADAIREPLAESSCARLAQDIDSQAGSARANGGAKTNGTMKAVRFGGNKGQGDHGSGSRRASGNNWVPKGKAADSPRQDGNAWNENEGRGFFPTGFGANARNVWVIASQPYSGAHFATMPPALAERCIKAGCPQGGSVLDPFGGAGTTGLVADRLGRQATLIELNPEYRSLAEGRVTGDAPLFAEVSA
jgi:DNA modification methylase